jgi:hypothetical protein
MSAAANVSRFHPDGLNFCFRMPAKVRAAIMRLHVPTFTTIAQIVSDFPDRNLRRNANLVTFLWCSGTDRCPTLLPSNRKRVHDSDVAMIQDPKHAQQNRLRLVCEIFKPVIRTRVAKLRSVKSVDVRGRDEAVAGRAGAMEADSVEGPTCARNAPDVAFVLFRSNDNAEAIFVAGNHELRKRQDDLGICRDGLCDRSDLGYLIDVEDKVREPERPLDS